MITYEEFLKLGISLVPLGVEARYPDDEHYFCTPCGAKVLGWAVRGLAYITALCAAEAIWFLP